LLQAAGVAGLYAITVADGWRRGIGAHVYVELTRTGQGIGHTGTMPWHDQ